jgi:hypothetical protein
MSMAGWHSEHEGLMVWIARNTLSCPWLRGARTGRCLSDLTPVRQRLDRGWRSVARWARTAKQSASSSAQCGIRLI